MRFLKQKTISKYSPSDNALFVNQFGRAVMDLNGGLRLPKGSTAQRPLTTNSIITENFVRTPEGPNGYIRYNTDTNAIEGYINNTWQVIAAPGATGILKQTLGPGNYVTTIFGPLEVTPPSEDSVLVLVENVFQISQTNFNILYDYLTAGDAYIEFTSPPPLDKFITIYFGFAN
jgi:hypothetical protein